MQNNGQLNGLTLAYIGDAVYEVFIRDFLLNQGLTKPNHLHKEATKYVSARAQAEIIQAMVAVEGFLSEEELLIYKRGRNMKSHTSAKNTDIITYRIATGFEALIGYLHLNKQEQRLNEVLKWSLMYIGEKHEKTG